MKESYREENKKDIGTQLGWIKEKNLTHVFICCSLFSIQNRVLMFVFNNQSPSFVADS